jgi:acyl-CoA thioester hydrolase
MMRGPLGFSFANVFLTPQGSVDAPKVIHESIPRKSPMHEKCRFLGLFRPFEVVIHRLQRALSVSRPRLIPTFSTAVNTWQCDENDHLNVQFYTEFGHEASAHLLAELGLGPRAQRAAGLDVRAADDHIRYLREFREVDPVAVLSAPIEVGERHLLAYHEIRNAADGTVAATVRRRIICDRPWPAAFRARAEAAIVPLPDNARPHSVGKLTLPDLALDDAARRGLIEIGRSVITPAECDERGELLPHHQFGRYSDGAPLLWNHLGFDRAAMQDRGEGSVVVEMLNHYRRTLRAGDLVVVMSGLAGFTERVLTFTHFLFEAETGMLAACAEAVGMKLDQKIRKSMTFTSEDQARLGERQLRLAA